MMPWATSLAKIKSIALSSSHDKGRGGRFLN